MEKRKVRKAVLTAKARRAAYGQIFEWLYDHRHTVTDSVRAQGSFLWEGVADEMILDGVVSVKGSPPTRKSANKAWHRVTRYLAQEAENRKARLAARGHVSRRTKGWVPPSSAPAQPPPVPAISRRDTVPAPRLTPAASPAAVSSTAPSQAAATSTHDPARPHILNTVTPEEAEYLAPFSDRSENTRLQLLTNFRTMAHMDRFNRPFKK